MICQRCSLDTYYCSCGGCLNCGASCDESKPTCPKCAKGIAKAKRKWSQDQADCINILLFAAAFSTPFLCILAAYWLRRLMGLPV